MVVAVGNWCASERNEMGFLFAGQRMAMALLPFVGQHRLQSARKVSLAHLDGGIA